MSRIALNKIRTDGGTQPRAVIDDAAVEDYRERMEEGDKFPPVTLFYDGTDYWLADGFHRYRAAEQADFKDIEASVKQGTQRDAVLFSVGANKVNGLRRTNDDKRRAVTTLLSDEKWAAWSDREIAGKCGVSPPFVGDMRKLTVNVYSDDRAFQSKHGTPAKMKTAKIGRRRRSKAAPSSQGEDDAEDIGNDFTMPKQSSNGSKKQDPPKNRSLVSVELDKDNPAEAAATLVRTFTPDYLRTLSDELSTMLERALAAKERGIPVPAGRN